jgi:predicted RNA-binding protein YlxR (DUF448 family)
MPRHIPIRSCVVCRRRQEKRQLTRIVMTDEGLTRDPSGKRDGRGAYLCADATCWQRAASSDVLARALRHPLQEKDRQHLATLATEIALPLN